MVESDRRRVATFEKGVEDLRATGRALADRTARLRALQEQAAAAKLAADGAVSAQSALITQIDRRRDLNARLTGELLQARQHLAALEPVMSLPAGEAPARRLSPGDLEWPAQGQLSAGFGPQRAGVEIAAARGEAARAVEEGVVAFAEPFSGFGNLVVVAHGLRSYSLYGHLDSIAVTRGAHVSRGQALGAVGREPNGKPGLYFELRIDGRAVDPVQWLKKR
jgi:septal ring factor EnvC (AmiA/AmiB activator)